MPPRNIVHDKLVLSEFPILIRIVVPLKEQVSKKGYLHINNELLMNRVKKDSVKNAIQTVYRHSIVTNYIYRVISR